MATSLFVEPELIIRLHKTLSGVSKLRNHQAEIKNIKTPRDLLPRLLSGQIEVEAV